MASPVTVRRPLVTDAAQMARVHVVSWRQTYRGLVPDSVLDDPDLPRARERFWTGALTDERYSGNRVAVAERDGAVIGIAMSGPAEDADATWGTQLHLICVDAVHHGSGAGSALLDAVIDPSASAGLWVADPNPRAQAFYRKHGFRPDGHSKVEGGLRAVRLVRTDDERAGPGQGWCPPLPGLTGPSAEFTAAV
jgi:L-amino acid N-acyltransferase YncA